MTHVLSASNGSSNRGSGSNVVTSQVAVGPSASSALHIINLMVIAGEKVHCTYMISVKGYPEPAYDNLILVPFPEPKY